MTEPNSDPNAVLAARSFENALSRAVRRMRVSTRETFRRYAEIVPYRLPRLLTRCQEQRLFIQTVSVLYGAIMALHDLGYSHFRVSVLKSSYSILCRRDTESAHVVVPFDWNRSDALKTCSIAENPIAGLSRADKKEA
jgi:hypothetical protein